MQILVKERELEVSDEFFLEIKFFLSKRANS